MRITVDNSQGVVDQLVPKGSGKAAVEKILADIEKEVRSQKSTGAIEALPQVQPEQPPTPNTRSASGGRFRGSTPSRAGSAGRPRSDSTGRGKQGVWREAKGPPEKGGQFSRAPKTAKSGLNRWKNLMKPKPKNQASADLKAMLGVSSGNGKTPQPASQPAQDAAAGLKAMLGVKSAPPPSQKNADNTATNKSAGLKALLGVGSTAPPAPQMMDNSFPPPPPPPTPQVVSAPIQPTAADKLMQLMSSQQPQMQTPVPVSSSFNFSYVEEGKEAPEPPQPPQFVPQFAPQMPMQMAIPPPYGGMPMPFPNPPTMAPYSSPQPNGGGAVVSDEEFPPLGGPSVPPKTKAQEPEKKNSEKPKPFVIVPSVVKK